ncbi:histone-like nucleoid-structuring protein Lsr2 [Streptomyces sp. NPDC057695]|uniref:Lsr2 family DNA-binding protein n=1 Tax=unclassified Streptomyces TaxID=2593676 RepID=UPI00363B8DC6
MVRPWPGGRRLGPGGVRFAVFTASRLRDRVPVTEPDDRPPVATGSVRVWARANGYEVRDRGRVPLAILEAWETATRTC